MARLVLAYLAYVYICCCLNGVFAVSDTEFQAVIRRLEILENKDETNRQIIDGLREQVQTQSTTIEYLQQELASNYDTITSLTSVVTSLTEKVLTLTDEVSILEKDREDYQSDPGFKSFPDHPNGTVEELETTDVHGTGLNSTQSEKTEVEKFDKRQGEAPAKRLIVNPEIPVAFHAVISPNDVDHQGHYQNIVFDKILLNLGAGYHSQHGVFIAPTAGLYLFSTTIMSYVGAVSEFQVEIVKNGNLLGRVFTHGDSGRHDQSAMTVLVQLAVNDEVWIREIAGSRIFGSYFSSFDGLLLIPQ